MSIGQDLINKPKDDIRATQYAEEQADKKRSQSKSVLNLADVLEKKDAAADVALAEINKNQAKWAKQLTQEDLKQFEQKLKDLKQDLSANKISGGITPNAVISGSRRVDIRRAEAEIHTIQAIKFDKNGVMTFRTNASQKYGATHHIVRVQFLNFQAALNGGRLTNAFLDSYLKSAVKFDCDCGRHRFWYRYIATVGGFAYGKSETAFPKIRNPELTGLACKHVVRVMHTLARKPVSLRQAAKMHISRFRKDPNQVAKTLTKKQANNAKIIAKQGAQIRKRTEKMMKEVKAKIDVKLEKLTASTKKSVLKQLDFLRSIGVLSSATVAESKALIEEATKD